MKPLGNCWRERKFENLLKKFESHPLTQTIQADEAAETSCRARQQAAGQIETLRKAAGRSRGPVAGRGRRERNELFKSKGRL